MKKLIFVMFIAVFLPAFVVSIYGESADITKLISVLESGNPQQKIGATKELEKMGHEAKPAIPALIKALKSRDVSLRLSAEDALISIGKDAAAQIAKLDSREFIEIPALNLILEQIGEAAVPVIIEELKQAESFEKRMHLLITLGLMEKKATSALPALEEMEKREKSFETKILLQLIIAQIKRGKEGLEEIKKKNKWEADTLAEEEARLIKEAEELVKEATKIELTINSPELDTLLEMFGDDADEAISAMSQLLDKEDPDMRNVAIAGMCRIGEKNTQNKIKVIPYLKKSLKDESSLARTISAAMLVKFGEKEEAMPVLINALVHSKEDTEVMFALGGLIEGEAIVKDREALAALEKMLTQNTNINIVGAAALILAGSGDEAAIDVTISRLVEMLKSHELNERLVGVAILLRMGPKAKPAAAALKDAQRRETDSDTKSIMKIAIMAIGKTEDDIDSILAELKSTDRLIVFSAFSKLGELDSAGKRKALPSLLQMLRTADEGMKDSLIYAICRFGSDAEDAFSILIKLLEESIKENNTDCQFMIAGVLGEIGNAEAAPVLLKLLSSEDRRVSNSAQLSLINLGPKAKAIIPGLVEMAKNPELSRDALSVLRDVGLLETEEQANTLAELLESDSEEIAVDAWLALTEAGKKLAVPAFMQKLNSPKKLAQLLAAGGLGEIGKGDSRVVPALKSALEKEKDERVIQEINSALEKLAGKTAE